MGLIETIIKAGGPKAIEHIAQKFGLPANIASQAVGMLMPALSGGLQRNVQTPNGLGALLGALTKGQHEQYLDQPANLASDSAIQDGNGILGHILGGKDASRAVATTVASMLGIDANTVKGMLPMVASMAMGGLAKQSKHAGLTPEAAQQNPADMLGQVTKMFGVENAGQLLGKLFA